MWNNSTLFIIRYSSKPAQVRIPGCQVLDYSLQWTPAKLAAEVQRLHSASSGGRFGNQGPLPSRFFGTDGPCDSITVVLVTDADHATFARDFFRLLQREAAQRIAPTENAETGVTIWTSVESDVVLVIAEGSKTDEQAVDAIVGDLKSDEARIVEGQWHEISLARGRYLSSIRDKLIRLGKNVKARKDELVASFKESLDTAAADDRASRLCRYLVEALTDLCESGHDARQVDFTVATACANMERLAGSLATAAALAIARYRIGEAVQLAGMIDRDQRLLSAGVNDVRWLLEACETFCQQQEARQQQRRERKLTWLGIWLGMSQILLGITAFWPAAVTANLDADYSQDHHLTAMWFLAAPSLLILSGTALLFCTFYWLLSPKFALASNKGAPVKK